MAALEHFSRSGGPLSLICLVQLAGLAPVGMPLIDIFTLDVRHLLGLLLVFGSIVGGGFGLYRLILSRRRSSTELLEIQRLREQNARLRRANQTKDEFLANISHELRTPLTSILGFANVLEDQVDADTAEFVRMIKNSGQRLRDTLDSLLHLAKFRAGMVDLNLRRVDLIEEVQGTVEMFLPVARDKGLDLVVESEQEHIDVDIDVFCLERILTNLISNAVKFTDHGSVQVKLHATPETVTITVSDTGIGIKEEFLPLLYEEFRQESEGLSRSHQGVGLGLSIVKRMIEVLGGTIDVSSTKGEGSAFSVTLPRYRDDNGS